MGQQVVTIIVRQVGAAASAAAIRDVGVASNSAAGSIIRLTGALAALTVGLGAREILGLVDVYIRMNNQLRFASKSAEEFAAVQSAVRDVANETRQPIEETALLYRRLRAATRAMGTSNQEVLDTVKGLNAAILISGSNAQESRAGLIQFTQALQSGRLAGDELRSLLENITPLAEAIARQLGLTLGQLREQAKNIPVDLLFAAVQRATAEFSGQLDAVQFTIGQTFNVLRNELILSIGAFNEFFGSTVTVNEGIVSLASNVGELLKSGLVGLIRGFGFLLSAGADVVSLLEQLGLNAGNVTAAFLNAVSFFKVFFASVSTGFRTLLAAADGLVLSLLKLGNAAGLVSDAAVAAASANFADQLTKLNDSADALSKTFSEELDKVVKQSTASLKTFGEDNTASNKFKELSAGAIKLARDLAQLDLNKTSAFDLNAKGTNSLAGNLTSQQRTAIEAANKRIEAIVNRLLVSEQKLVDPLNAQLERLIQQRIELEKQAKIAGVTEKVLQGRALVDAQILTIQTKQGDAGLRLSDLIGETAANIAEIRSFAPDMATQLENSATAAVDMAAGSKQAATNLEKVNQEARDFLKERQGIVRELGEGLVTGIAQPLSQALRGVLQGEAFNFAEVLASASENLLGNAFDALAKQLSAQVGSIFQQAFGSDTLGAAGLSAALGVGIGLVAGAFKGTSSNISNGLAKSAAVQDAQATRGVVVGPTNVPIFQLGESIETAFIPTNALLSEIRDGIFALLGQPIAGGGGSDAATSELLRTTPSLV